MAEFWVSIRKGDTDMGSVPVGCNSFGDWQFYDCAYGVFDHYYRPGEESLMYDEFEAAVLAVCPELAGGPELEEMTVMANGDEFKVMKQYLDRFGN